MGSQAESTSSQNDDVFGHRVAQSLPSKVAGKDLAGKSWSKCSLRSSCPSESPIQVDLSSEPDTNATLEKPLPSLPEKVRFCIKHPDTAIDPPLESDGTRLIEKKIFQRQAKYTRVGSDGDAFAIPYASFEYRDEERQASSMFFIQVPAFPAEIIVYYPVTNRAKRLC